MKIKIIFLITWFLLHFVIGEDIFSCTDLQNMTVKPPKDYNLRNDINCTNLNFQPIGGTYDPFTRTLNGNGFCISGININSTILFNVGIFATGSNAKLINIVIKDVKMSLSSKSNVGIFFGECIDCSFSNISIEATDKNILEGGFVGSLSGLTNGGTVNNTKIVSTSIIAETTGGGYFANVNSKSVKFSSSEISSCIIRSKRNAGGYIGYTLSEIQFSECTSSYNNISVTAITEGYSSGFVAYSLYGIIFFTGKSNGNLISSFSSLKNAYSAGFVSFNKVSVYFDSSISEGNIISSESTKSSSFSGAFLGYGESILLTFSGCSSTDNNIFGKYTGYLWGLVKGAKRLFIPDLFTSNNHCNNKNCGRGSTRLTTALIIVIIVLCVIFGSPIVVVCLIALGYLLKFLFILLVVLVEMIVKAIKSCCKKGKRAHNRRKNRRREEKRIQLENEEKIRKEKIKEGWSAENHHYFKEQHRHVLTFLLCFKMFEDSHDTRIPKYLKQEIIKSFVDDPVAPKYLSLLKKKNDQSFEKEYISNSKNLNELEIN